MFFNNAHMGDTLTSGLYLGFHGESQNTGSSFGKTISMLQILKSLPEEAHGSCS